MQGLSVKKAVEEIEKEVPDSEPRKEILDFVKSSSRGLMKGYTSAEEE